MVLILFLNYKNYKKVYDKLFIGLLDLFLIFFDEKCICKLIVLYYNFNE